jgi:hypothetical protein
MNTQQKLNQSQLDALLNDDLLDELEAELNAEPLVAPEALVKPAVKPAIKVAKVVEAKVDDLDGLNDVADELDDLSDLDSLNETADETVAETAKISQSEAWTSGKSEVPPTVNVGKVSKTKTPRLSTAGLKPSEILRAKLGEKVYEYCVLTTQQAELPEDELKASVDDFLANVLDKQAKKVKEKSVNLFLALAGHAKLSCFTERALTLLKAGDVSIGDIRKNYLARPYSPGTSSAQASQMAMLLPQLKLAERESGRMTANPDSLLLQIM